MITHPKIGIVGLGYVGLPLAVAFSKNFNVIGLDISEFRIAELKSGIDSTLEVEGHSLKAVSYTHLTLPTILLV